jgi:hypothetical protein
MCRRMTQGCVTCPVTPQWDDASCGIAPQTTSRAARPRGEPGNLVGQPRCHRAKHGADVIPETG